MLFDQRLDARADQRREYSKKRSGKIPARYGAQLSDRGYLRAGTVEVRMIPIGKHSNRTQLLDAMRATDR
jgi:hypothetical protein